MAHDQETRFGEVRSQLQAALCTSVPDVLDPLKGGELRPLGARSEHLPRLRTPRLHHCAFSDDDRIALAWQLPSSRRVSSLRANLISETCARELARSADTAHLQIADVME
jgi:hypothetical protein